MLPIEVSSPIWGPWIVTAAEAAARLADYVAAPLAGCAAPTKRPLREMVAATPRLGWNAASGDRRSSMTAVTAKPSAWR